MTAPGGGYTSTTATDDAPATDFGNSADNGAAVTDNSADVNVNGANSVAGWSAAEAAEIAAVPDPQSPAGQAAIMAIIEKYQGKSAGTVEGSAASEQASGDKAASDDSGSGGDSGLSSLLDALSGLGGGLGGMGGLGGLGGGGLMDLLTSLLGGGMGGGLGQGMDPFGQGTLASSTQATDPFADPFGGSQSTPAGSSGGSGGGDPFDASGVTGTVTTADNGTTTDDSSSSSDTAEPASASSTDTTAASTDSPSVDISAFSDSAGAGVPADPSTTK